MSPARHCDEIIRLIDGVLGELMEPHDLIPTADLQLPFGRNQRNGAAMEVAGSRVPRLTATHARSRQRLLRRQGPDAVAANP